MHRQNRPTLAFIDQQTGKRELPVGSELIIACTLGLAGWWGLVHLVMWIANK